MKNIMTMILLTFSATSWAAVNPEAEWVLHCPELRMKWEEKAVGANFDERPWVFFTEYTVKEAIFDYQKWNIDMVWTKPLGGFYSGDAGTYRQAIKMNNSHLILIEGSGLNVRYKKSLKELQLSYSFAYENKEGISMVRRRSLTGLCDLTKDTQ